METSLLTPLLTAGMEDWRTAEQGGCTGLGWASFTARSHSHVDPSSPGPGPLPHSSGRQSKGLTVCDKRTDAWGLPDGGSVTGLKSAGPNATQVPGALLRSHESGLWRPAPRQLADTALPSHRAHFTLWPASRPDADRAMRRRSLQLRTLSPSQEKRCLPGPGAHQSACLVRDLTRTPQDGLCC